MTDIAAGERLVLPRRSHTWRSANGLLVLGVVGLGGAVVWATTEHTRVGPLVLAVLSVALWLLPVVRFARDEDRNRLVVDDIGISSSRRGELVATTEWARMTYVEFDSGSRLSSWDKYPPGILGFVRCHDDRPHNALSPSDVGAYVELPVFGRRGLREVDDLLREACAEHDVEYRSYWSWAWRISLRSPYRHVPDPKPSRRPL